MDIFYINSYILCLIKKKSLFETALLQWRTMNTTKTYHCQNLWLVFVGCVQRGKPCMRDLLLPAVMRMHLFASAGISHVQGQLKLENKPSWSVHALTWHNFQNAMSRKCGIQITEAQCCAAGRSTARVSEERQNSIFEHGKFKREGI